MTLFYELVVTEAVTYHMNFQNFDFYQILNTYAPKKANKTGGEALPLRWIQPIYSGINFAFPPGAFFSLVSGPTR